MPFEKIDIHPINLERSKLNLKKYAPTEQEYKTSLKWLENVSIEKSLSARRQERLLHDLVLFFKIYKKPTNKITKEDLVKLKESFLNKKILSNDDKPYSDSVVEGLTETIVRYLEDTYPKRMNEFISSTNKPLRSWFIMRGKKKTPEILNENEIKKLYKETNLLWQKYAIAVLFGSGARIEEFLNFRFEDFEEPTKNFPYWQVDIKEEYSKTLGRKVGLYWDYCTEAIAKYLASIERKNVKDRVLEVNYDAVRMFLTRLGKRVLNKRVHPHLFRHSAATRMANRLNRQDLCIYFGWRFSSPMPDLYISRGNVEQRELDEKFKKSDMEDLKEELETQKRLFKIDRDNMLKSNEETKKWFIETLTNFKKEMLETKDLLEVATTNKK